MKKTTINDIAVHLGVSKTLVSFVLNGKGKEYHISDSVCKKVLDTAKEMNYQPNKIAKSLRTGKTNTIGLIISDISNPFFGKLCREIEEEAAKYAYNLIICSSDENPVKSEKQIAMMQANQVDGYIISPPVNSEEQIYQLSKGQIPFVLIDRYFSQIECSYVGIDNFNAAYNATSHLLKLGRNKIANITLDLDLINMRDRIEGYRKAINDAHIISDTDLIKALPFSHDNKDVAKAIQELIPQKGDNKADAILFSTSKIGTMGIEYILRMGIRVPEDIAIVSFDDPDAYKLFYSPVTAVKQPLEEIGRTAVRILLGKFSRTENKDTIHKIILDADLIVRKSCGF